VSDYFRKDRLFEKPPGRIPSPAPPRMKQSKIDPSAFRRAPPVATPNLCEDRSKPLLSPHRSPPPVIAQPLTPKTSPASKRQQQHQPVISPKTITLRLSDEEEPGYSPHSPLRAPRSKVLSPPSPRASQESDNSIPEELREGHEEIRRILLGLSEEERRQLNIDFPLTPEKPKEKPRSTQRRLILTDSADEEARPAEAETQDDPGLPKRRRLLKMLVPSSASRLFLIFSSKFSTTGLMYKRGSGPVIG